MNTQTVVFGGGCFWCIEAVYKEIKGVTDVTSGYAGGAMDNPNYEQVSGGSTGHVEVVKVEFDPAVISFNDMLEVFFAVHDPTTLNRQGNDVGEQYRSAIYYTTDQQKQELESFIQKLKDDNVYDQPITTEIKALDKFYEAEDYHQDYFEKNPTQPYCQLIVNPKVKKFKEKFSSLLKK